MDIAAKAVFAADGCGDGIDAGHGFVRVAGDAGTEEQAVDFFGLQVLHENIGGFLNAKCTAANVIFIPKGAVQAVIAACVGDKCLK